MLTQVQTENGLIPVMIALGLLNFGAAPTVALGTDMMIASAPPEKAGAVSAISETCHELGLGMGTAVLDAARAAFTDGLLYVSVICTVVTLLTVLTVAFLLGPVPTGEGHGPGGGGDGTGGPGALT